MKPFKPLTLARPSLSGPPDTDDTPPVKKRRLLPFEDDDPTVAADRLMAADVARMPLHEVTNHYSSSQTLSSPVSKSIGDHSDACHYTVLWRKKTAKKNKTWDGDGVLTVSNGLATLKDISGKEVGRTAYSGPLLAGSELSVSGKDVEIDSLIPQKDYAARKPFVDAKSKPVMPDSLLKQVQSRFKVPTTVSSTVSTQPRASQQPAPRPTKVFKTPVINSTVQLPQKATSIPTPRHDPKAEGALVMPRPKRPPPGKQIVDVVVDPLLTQRLREHQREGVSFLYECVMGMKDYGGEGAILADEMGLGKTLQTIALLWTLLKQNAIYGDAPIIKKALIVCPVTLISNWRKEFTKWLSRDRIGVFVLDEKRNKITDFTRGKAYNVMIIGYEKLRNVQNDLQKANIDIVIADEGHRLKTAQNKCAQAIKALNTERRIILSGTPLQNDLTEFFTMVDFVNPGLLNKYSTFKREYENPILKARQPGATPEDVEKGEECSQGLANTTKKFILRRTADETLAKYLPPKTEYVLFCRPTDTQVSVYKALLASPVFSAALGSSKMALELINILKKVCNSPNLLTKNNKGDESTKPEYIECIPPSMLKTPAASAKLQVLDTLLHHINTTTEEKVVVVSNYTSMLDLIGAFCVSLGYKFLRLDGTIPPNKRQELVDRFNRSPQSNSFVFLLSAKAGGVGLNLIGASRLILFDLDWNPATDLQAMARIHRDGQKKPVFIYRMVIQGGLEEKIFQRQVSKTGLADSIVDSKSSVSGFTQEELRNLFTLDEKKACQTHDLLLCPCGGAGMVAPGIEASSIVTTEDGIEVLDMQDEEDEEFLPKNDFIPGSQYDEKEGEMQRKAKECRDANGKVKMLSLMQYAHFDTANVPQEHDVEDDNYDDDDPDALDMAIDDETLKSALREKTCRIGYVFSKTSR